MSGILAIVGPTACDEDVLRTMVGRMASRGHDLVAQWARDNVALAVCRNGWELQPDFSGEALIVEAGDLVVAADASLYYRSDLQQKLERAGVPVLGDSPSHFVLAAYRAWGPACARELEGDFAWIVWDGVRRALCGSRDLGGRRPMHYASIGDHFLAASTVGAIVAHPNCPPALDPVTLAATATGLVGSAGHETVYTDVHRLPAGHTFIYRDRATRVEPHWTPTIAEDAAASLEDGAAELASLLERAVGERMSSDDPTAVWLSGGWDSTAIWGTANHLLAKTRPARRRIHPISISYPPGDPGREDEIIQEAVGFWDGASHWLAVDEIPLIHDGLEAATHRDEPFAHMFEMWNRRLAAASRATGARISMDGFGGDQLFQLSDIYLGDLVHAGRWREAWSEWRLKGRPGWRNAVAEMLQPAAPRRMARWLERLSGLRTPGSLTRPIAPWIEREFVRRTDLIERERPYTPARVPGRGAETEMRFYLECPYFHLIASELGRFGLETGVETRAPLYDRRIVEFALRRPRHERTAGRETKRALRAAMQNRLPPSVLAPRTHRTGITSGYAIRALQAQWSKHVERTFASKLLLAELGIVNPTSLRQYAERDPGQLDGNARVLLWLTIQTEWWLRARERGSHGDPAARLMRRHHPVPGDPATAGVAGCSEPAARSYQRRPNVSEARAGTFRYVPGANSSGPRE